jgi:hypothetical protein
MWINGVDEEMKITETKKGYRLFTESEKRDNKLRDALKDVRGTKKHYPTRDM